MKLINVKWLSFTVLFGCSSVVPISNRIPASVREAQDPVALEFEATPPTLRAVQLRAATRVVKVCGLNFEEVAFKSSHPEVSMNRRSEKLKGSFLRHSVPDGPVFKDGLPQAASINLLRGVTYSYRSKLPLLPNIPITEAGLTKELCQHVRNYHGLATKNLTTYTFDRSAEARSLGRIGSGSTEQAQRRQQTASQRGTYQSLIIYDDLYEKEAQDLAQLQSERGIPTLATAVSELPGLGQNEPVPTECQGSFYKECYHTWGDPIRGISQLAVPSLKGFYAETKIHERYNKVAYIPGLIRAYLRQLRRVHAVTGIFLIGPEEVLTPHYLTIDKYGSSSTLLTPGSKLQTDVFYAVPSLALAVKPELHHDSIMPAVWSCRNSQNTVRLGNWCLDDEWRFWPTPALSAYRWPAVVPLARVFETTQPLFSTWFQNLPITEILAVGRYPTQERFIGVKDHTVADYVEKVRRWHNELPTLKNNSIGSHGGTTNDDWVFEEQDNLTFKSVYGAGSKIYASEFFVPLPKCSTCKYKTGNAVIAEVAEQNRTSMMITAHGGNFATQAPYANGNIASTYSGENSYRYELGELRKMAYRAPAYASVKYVQDSGSLVGHVFANSCSTSNYNLDSGLSYEFYKLDPTANQRSFAEQWLTMPDAGALNTFMNSDVGWGGGDNALNQKFMTKIDASWDVCGSIGDAYRSVLSEMFKGNTGGAWDWQLYNRQFLGAPSNDIAQRDTDCRVRVPPPNDPGPILESGSKEIL